MASAKKCDRCGRYYDRNTKYKANGHSNHNLDGVATTNTVGMVERSYDLCDECITEFFEQFLTGGKNDDRQ